MENQKTLDDIQRLSIRLLVDASLSASKLLMEQAASWPECMRSHNELKIRATILKARAVSVERLLKCLTTH